MKNKLGRFKKGNIPWITGKKHTEETKQKIRLARAKQIISKESYEKMKIARKKTTQKRGYYFSEETKQQISLAHKGKPKLWLRGIPHSKERKEKISKSNHGKIISIHTRKLLSKLNMGKKNPNYGLKRSDETRRLMRIARAKQIVPVKDTSIEVKI